MEEKVIEDVSKIEEEDEESQEILDKLDENQGRVEDLHLQSKNP